MRRRLTLLVASTTLLVLIAFLVPLAVLVKQITEDRALSRATVVVQAIVPLIGTSDANAIRLAVTGQPVPVTVFLPDGQVLGTTADRTPAVRLAEARGRSLTVADGGDREIVVPVVSGGQTTVVRTVVTADELTRGVTQAWLVLAALGIALVLLGLLVADRLARTIVAPIARSGRGLAPPRPGPPRRPRESHRATRGARGGPRAEPTGRPDPGPAARRARAGRRPVPPAPHPAHRAAPGGRVAARPGRRGPDRRGRGRHRTRGHRGDPAGPPARGGEARARAATRRRWCADRVAFWTVLAEDTDRAVRQEIPDAPIPVSVPADDLAAALDALLANVFAHTPDGTALSVTLAARPGGGATLTVADSGPGFGPSHTGVLRRGESGGNSTGLGMDIARRAAEAGGGSLHIGEGPDGGAQVRLDLAGDGDLLDRAHLP